MGVGIRIETLPQLVQVVADLVEIERVEILQYQGALRDELVKILLHTRRHETCPPLPRSRISTA